MSQKSRVLIVDDEAPIREVLCASLQDENYDVRLASQGEEAIKMIGEFQPHVVLLDIWMPGTYDGIDVLRIAKPKFPNVEYIVMSGHGNIETAVRATKLGAWDFVEKPLSMEKIFILLTNIILYQREKGEKRSLLNRLRKNIAIIGEHAAMMALKQTLSRVASSPAPVLIYGEKGSGKELSALNLHYLSARASSPFVEVSCSTLSPDLMEMELFGYEKGAFAGAQQATKGKLDHANGGTLYIDEISDLTLSSQQKLSEYLSSGKFTRVGGEQKIEGDVRIIVASTRDLSILAKEAKFHAPLLQMLQSDYIKIPPLKDRKEDIPALILHFSEYFAKEGASKPKVFSAEAMDHLKQYQWSGNVRELRNFVERIYILTPSEEVNVHDLKFAGLNVGDELGEDSVSQISNFKMARAQFEKEYILKKLAENNGNVSKTAEVIGLERSHLHRKIKSYGIDVV
ncbi:MAG: sigma-54-dependent transcriptional regulator [Bdellovibrionales bacterium]